MQNRSFFLYLDVIVCTIRELFHDIHKFYDAIFVITDSSNILFPFAQNSGCHAAL